jgi:flagellar assembly factor FliW
MKTKDATLNFSRAPAMEVAKDNRCVIKTVNPENIFTFPEGILGFKEIQEYCILLNDKVKPFMFMQALDGSDICFVCVESFLICPDYSLTIPDKTIQLLDLTKPEEALILSLVTVRKNIEDITANLMSPIIVNMHTSKAQQVIIENSNYPVRYKIWDHIEDNAAIFSAS